MHQAPVHISSDNLKSEIAPEQLGLQFTSVERCPLNGLRQFKTNNSEHAFVLLSGSLKVVNKDFSCTMSPRDTLFLPPNTNYELTGSKALFMRYAAPSDASAPPSYIPFRKVDDDPVRHKHFGSREHGTAREVWMILNDDFPCSRLMIGICSGSPGGWTAWPPHEHGKQREEIYYYFDMPGTFGIQLVYNELQQPGAAIVVSEGDLLSIPEGYHPNVGSPAGGITYIYCMVAVESGKRDFMDLSMQPEFAEHFGKEMD